MFVITKKNNDAGAYVLRNYKVETGNHGEMGWPLWLAGRATSAAPLYFPPYISGSDKYYDGGMGYPEMEFLI